MDLYFRRPAEFLERYNCSFYDWHPEAAAERRSVPFAVVYLLMGMLEEVLYVPVVWVLLRRRFRQLFCYRLMLLMALYDVVLLPVTAFATGYFTLQGTVFCDRPVLIYFLGLWLYALWMGYSMLAVFLAFNRCVCFTRFRFLFEGGLQWLWLGAPLLYTALELVFGMPVIFSAFFSGWFFNPHMGFREDVESRYVNYNHILDNLLVAVLIPALYVFFYVFLQRFGQAAEMGPSKAERSLFLQVFGMSCVLSVGAMGYVVMQLLPMPRWVIYSSHLIWLLVQGAPPIIYLTRNRSFRRLIFGEKGWFGVSSSTERRQQSIRTRTRTVVNATESHARF